MVHQAEVNTNGKANAQPNVAASFSCLAHDAIELAELQAKLLKLDAQSAARNSGIGTVLLMVAACVLMASATVLLFALGNWFATLFGWSRSIALAAAAGLGIAASVAAVVAAWLRIRLALASLERSRNELSRNIAWIKTNLKRGKPDSTSPNPVPRSFSNQ